MSITTPAEMRDFPTLVIASLSSGIMLAEPFSAMHEAAEFIMGHPIWTHHFADEQLLRDLRRTIDDQCPGMPAPGTISSNNWRAEAERLEKQFGLTVKIRKGGGLTAMLPTDGIPDHLKNGTILAAVAKSTSPKSPA